MAAIPAAIDALIARLTAAANITGHVLSGVQILDGPPLTNVEPDVIVVGFTPDGVSVEGEQSPGGLTAQTQSLGVNCLVSSWSGDEAMKPVRDHVFTLLSAVEAEVKQDPTLAGAVADARLQFLDFDQQQDTSGATATVAFTIRISAFV